MPDKPPIQSQSLVSRKMLGMGLLAGVAIGAVATVRVRNLNADPDSDRREPTSVADWDRATQIATTMNRADALSIAQRDALDREYRALVEQCLPLVSSYMGVTIPSPVERTYAFDRVDWINANVTAFRNLLTPLNDLLVGSAPEKSVIGGLLGSANRQVVSAELGMLLGYLARRVLGQYDLALLGGESEGPGKLYFVQPNIAATETLLGIPKDEFRLWLALHEMTHVFQFEGFPWVKPYFQSLLDEYFVFLKSDISELKSGMRAMKVMVGRVREGQRDNQSWIESLMTPDQRSVFSRIQALMCIIEGYSNHVMNAVGKDLMPNYARIARKFEHRQRNKSWGEQLLARMTGLDVKLEQYRLGEEFINAIVAERGHDMALAVWSGPESLPTLEELRNPAAWITRIDASERATLNGESAAAP